VNHGNAFGDDATDPALADRVRGLMPRLTAELVELVAIPSVSEAGFAAASRPALLQARDAVAALFQGAGCERVSSLELPDTAPMVTAEIPAPEGAPTVLMYSHTTSSRSVTGRCGTRRRLSRPSVTARSSGAAPRTPSRTSWPTSARCGLGAGVRRSA
jgi:hypothetical protein